MEFGHSFADGMASRGQAAWRAVSRTTTTIGKKAAYFGLLIDAAKFADPKSNKTATALDVLITVGVVASPEVMGPVGVVWTAIDLVHGVDNIVPELQPGSFNWASPNLGYGYPGDPQTILDNLDLYMK